MAARRRVTSKLQVQYRKAAKADKGEILDRWWPPRGWVVRRLGVCYPARARRIRPTRSTAAGCGPGVSATTPGRIGARTGVDGHAVRQVPDGDARSLVAAAGSAGDLTVRLPPRRHCGVDDDECGDGGRVSEGGRDRMAIKGISTTKPSPLLWNSIVIRICRPEQRRHAGPARRDLRLQL